MEWNICTLKWKKKFCLFKVKIEYKKKQTNEEKNQKNKHGQKVSEKQTNSGKRN